MADKIRPDIRLPKDLHRAAVKEAERSGLSLNAWLVQIVAVATGKSDGTQRVLADRKRRAAR